MQKRNILVRETEAGTSSISCGLSLVWFTSDPAGHSIPFILPLFPCPGKWREMVEGLRKSLKLLVFLVCVRVRIGLCLNGSGAASGMKNDFALIQFSGIQRKLVLKIQKTDQASMHSQTR